MSESRKPQGLTAKDLIDYAFTLLIIGISMYPLYRDDLKRLKMKVQQLLHAQRDREQEILEQVQKEISQMEHGEFGAC